MHLDRRVASVDTAGRSRVYFRSFLPYNLFLEEEQDIDTLVNNLTNFYYWCSESSADAGSDIRESAAEQHWHAAGGDG